MSESLATVVTEIRSLLDQPPDGELPPRVVVEHTLTNGYAHALGLERERLRIERRLRALVRTAGSSPASKAEVAELTRLLASADQQLAALRRLLSSFRSHAL